MGSFLISCGISNRVLTEGTEVSLLFVAHQIMDREGKPASMDFFKNWYAEELLIEGIQDDYGYVRVSEEYKDHMIEIMANLAVNSAEKPSDNQSHPSWKQYFDLNMKNIESMNLNKIQEHFNNLLSILHNSGVVYRSPIQGSISIMKVAHIDQVVIDTILETPLAGDNLYLQYKGEYSSRYILNNFEDYIDFLIMKHKNSFEECLKDQYASLRIDEGSDKNYHSLLRSPYMGKNDRQSLENILDFAINNRLVFHMLSYIEMMGVKIQPSNCASQDYQESSSINYRNVMTKIFEKQKEQLLERRIESSWENGESVDGSELDESVSLESQMKNVSKLKDLPEFILEEKRLVVVPEAENWDFLQETKKKSSLKP